MDYVGMQCGFQYMYVGTICSTLLPASSRWRKDMQESSLCFGRFRSVLLAVVHAGTDCLTATECTADEETTQAKSRRSSSRFRAPPRKSTIRRSSNERTLETETTAQSDSTASSPRQTVKEHYADKHYHFIDNNDVTELDLHDGLHLNEEAAKKLAINIGRAIRGQPSINTAAREDQS